MPGTSYLREWHPSALWVPQKHRLSGEWRTLRNWPKRQRATGSMTTKESGQLEGYSLCKFMGPTENLLVNISCCLGSRQRNPKSSTDFLLLRGQSYTQAGSVSSHGGILVQTRIVLPQQASLMHSKALFLKSPGDTQTGGGWLVTWDPRSLPPSLEGASWRRPQTTPLFYFSFVLLILYLKQPPPTASCCLQSLERWWGWGESKPQRQKVCIIINKTSRLLGARMCWALR